MLRPEPENVCFPWLFSSTLKHMDGSHLFLFSLTPSLLPDYFPPPLFSLLFSSPSFVPLNGYCCVAQVILKFSHPATVSPDCYGYRNEPFLPMKLEAARTEVFCFHATRSAYWLVYLHIAPWHVTRENSCASIEGFMFTCFLIFIGWYIFLFYRILSF